MSAVTDDELKMQETVWKMFAIRENDSKYWKSLTSEYESDILIDKTHKNGF